MKEIQPTKSNTLTVAEDTMIDGVFLDQALVEYVVAAADIAQLQGELQGDLQNKAKRKRNKLDIRHTRFT